MNDEKEIRAAVEDKKKKARESGLVDNVFKLYRDHLRYLNQGFDHEKSCIPRSVTSIERGSHRDGYDSVETVKVSMVQETYLFSFSERPSAAPDDDSMYGTIQVKQGESLLLEISCIGKDERYTGMTWKVHDVKAFLEGPWVAEVNHLARQIFGRHEQRSAEFQKAMEQKEIEELKTKFGL